MTRTWGWIVLGLLIAAGLLLVAVAAGMTSYLPAALAEPLERLGGALGLSGPRAGYGPQQRATACDVALALAAKASQLREAGSSQAAELLEGQIAYWQAICEGRNPGSIRL